MTAQAQSSHQETERQVIERLRTRYEDEGYAFEAHPSAARLPAFFDSYLPDALASRHGQNIAIEVARRPSLSTEPSLKDIRRLFDGHPDWQLRVIYLGVDPLQSVAIPAAKPADIRANVENVRALMAQGQPRAAFIIAWSLLEAALGTAHSEQASRPRTPGTVVQALATNGLIDPDLEQQLRALIDLRNRIVHGDLEADASAAEVEAVLSGVDHALTEASQLSNHSVG